MIHESNGEIKTITYDTIFDEAMSDTHHCISPTHILSSPLIHENKLMLNTYYFTASHK